MSTRENHKEYLSQCFSQARSVQNDNKVVCYFCRKLLNFKETYFIMEQHQYTDVYEKQRNYKIFPFYFHEECFKQIAGKEYYIED